MFILYMANYSFKRRFDRGIIFKIWILLKLSIILLAFEIILEAEEILFFGHKIAQILTVSVMIIITIALVFITYSMTKHTRNF